MKLAICGSMATQELMNDMVEVGKKLETMDIDILLPAVEETTSDYTGLTEEQVAERKSGYLHRHFRKIEDSDGVMILNYNRKNIDGYIGANTLIEMAIAAYLNKKIYVLNSVNRDLASYDEVIGMKPTFLNGDWSKLND